jgi:hypothetical protein
VSRGFCQLRAKAWLPRQRPRVRVPSSPPFILKQLVNGDSTSAYPQFHPEILLNGL